MIVRVVFFCFFMAASSMYGARIWDENLREWVEVDADGDVVMREAGDVTDRLYVLYGPTVEAADTFRTRRRRKEKGSLSLVFLRQDVQRELFPRDSD